MIKQLSALVLTVTVSSSSWADGSTLDYLQSDSHSRLGLVLGEQKVDKDMNSSLILGVGHEKGLNTSTLSASTLPRVDSKEKLFAKPNSDLEKGEKEVILSRQNSQENLKKAEHQSQGWRASVGGFLRSVGNFFTGAWNAVKVMIWG